MVIAMLLAHLVGDFILQWDKLAQWKSREFKGVLVHSFIVFLITTTFALPFRPLWWQGILFISVAHLAIDGVQFLLKPPLTPLTRFLIDQALHLLVIVVALVGGGFLQPNTWAADVHAALEQELMVSLLGYAFLTMPTWVLLKFLGYSLICGKAPEFLEGKHKYLSIAERLLIATLVLTGQFLLVPLVALPRLLLHWPRLVRSERRSLYLFETVAGVFLAVVVGLGLRLL